MTGPILGHWCDRDTAGDAVGHGFLSRYPEEQHGPEYEQACQSWGRTLDF